MVKGAYSSANDPILDNIAGLFPRTTDTIYYSYNGPNNPDYSPEDTTSRTLTEYAHNLFRYFTAYSNAQFSLVCHSLGGLITLRMLYDRRSNQDFCNRITVVYLLCVPVHLDGAGTFASSHVFNLKSPLWRVIADYNVEIRDIPVLNRIVSLHCEDDYDTIALFEDTCLLDFEEMGLLRADDQINTELDHFGLPTALSTRDRLKPYIS